MQLSHEQSVSLMQKLAGDDLFRAAFEKDPTSALLEAGIGKDQVVALDAKCRQAAALAPKEHFSRLLADVTQSEFQTAMAFHVFQLK